MGIFIMKLLERYILGSAPGEDADKSVGKLQYRDGIIPHDFHQYLTGSSPNFTCTVVSQHRQSGLRYRLCNASTSFAERPPR